MLDLTIKSLGGEDIELLGMAPDINKAGIIKNAQGIYMRGAFGGMLFQRYLGNHFAFWYSQYNMTMPVTLIAYGDIPVLELQIPLQDNFDSTWDGFGKMKLQKLQAELSYAPHINNVSVFERKNYKTFDVHYELGFLQSFAEQFPPLNDFIEKINRKQPAHLFGPGTLVTEELFKLAKEIIANRYEGFVADRFYESTATIMLIRSLERLDSVQLLRNRVGPKDIECAMEAQRIILSDLTQFYTIAELAKKLATNVYKLKTAFRLVHNTTIFRYSQKVRIDRAKILLLDNRFSYQSIAEEIGYTQDTNFQNMFKKITGITPGEYKRTKS